MRYDAKLSFRARRYHVERATDIAEKMLRLPEYELVGPTARSVIRMALDRGAKMLNAAQQKYFSLEEARNLARQLGEGTTFTTTEGFTVTVPSVNPYNVYVTPAAHADALFARGVVDILEGTAAAADDAKQDQLIHVRMPQTLLTQIKQAISRLPRAPRPFDTSQAAVRLMLEIGLFLVTGEVYWRRNQLKDPELENEMRGIYQRRNVEQLRLGKKVPKRRTPTSEVSDES